MRRSTVLLVAASMLAPACGRQSPNDEPKVEHRATSVTSVAQQNTAAPTVEENSADAAVQLVQNYGALIEQKRWSDANALWGDTVAAAKFQSRLAQAADVHLESGNPGDPEGAAGSIYVTVPVIIYGDAKDGQPFRRSADVILRRVNDVPGSTEQQRRWHIERIDWAS